MSVSASAALMERFLALHPKRMDLSLERILALLDDLGRPQDRLPPVIHVAGTNGKGSTCAFLRAMIEAGGRAAHVYTSPHLVRFHERIRLAGALVGEDALTEAFEHVEAVNGGRPITVFEITTAAAFHLFATHPADCLVLEVGLGGRFDATNVIDRPICSVITPISFDHREFLGDTIAAIAWSKAGIIKRGAPAVIGPQRAEARAVLLEEVETVGARALLHGEHFHAHEEHGRLVYQDADGLIDLPLPRLAGRHQIDNAAGAIAAMREAFPALANPASLAQGLSRVDWPARMQRLGGALAARAPQGAELWLDGGHNQDGGAVVAAAIGELEERSPKPIVLIVGMLASKDPQAFLANFAGLAQRLVAVPIGGQEHAARSADDIAAVAASLGIETSVAPTLEGALASPAHAGFSAPPRILITGSLYLAGEALALDGSTPA